MQKTQIALERTKGIINLAFEKKLFLIFEIIEEKSVSLLWKNL